MSDYIVISSSGGSGHKVAAKMLMDLKKAKDPSRQTLELDVMSSGCSFGSFIGETLTGMWNVAQQEGDIYRQRNLFVLQPLAEKIFFASTFVTVLWKLLWCKEAPKVVCVQPLHLLAITSAVMAANFLKFRTKKIEKVDLYFTDLPSVKAEHFMGALQRLHNISTRAFNMVRVCAPDPIDEKGQSNQEFWSQHNVKWIKKKSLPLNLSFKELDNLPLPGTDQLIRLKNGEEYKVQAKDKVGFIMLGSNPEKTAILNYIDGFIKAGNKRKFNENDPVHYLFVACGKSEDNELLKKALKKVQDANLDAHVKIVPFENQSITSIFARSDMSFTRSGGMTASEILALKSRSGDNKKIYIHSPINETLIGSDKNVKKYLLGHIPLWENGNAEQLMWHKDVQAEVIYSLGAFDIFEQFFK